MCTQCEVIRINERVCHEHGCDEAWKDERRECRECGSEFKPKDRFQTCCSKECTAARAGFPFEEGENNEG